MAVELQDRFHLEIPAAERMRASLRPVQLLVSPSRPQVCIDGVEFQLYAGHGLLEVTL